MYTKEGLAWTEIALPDARPVVDTIGNVFGMLDENNIKLTKNQPATDVK